MFEHRYCELLLITIGQAIDLWGTQGVNTCPAEQWESVNFAAVANAYGADAWSENGPRFFTVDAGDPDLIAPNPNYLTAQFGPLEMRFLARVIPPNAGTARASPPRASAMSMPPGSAYQVATVLRNNTWLFYAGRRVYELTGPDGNRYIMQSYSQIVDENLQLEDLESLGARLALPSGWSFSTRVLVESLAVAPESGSGARVVQDDLANSYQQYDEPAPPVPSMSSGALGLMVVTLVAVGRRFSGAMERKIVAC